MQKSRKLAGYFFLGLLIISTIQVYSQPVPSLRPHPGYDNTNILPPSLSSDQKGLGGVAWLDDGRLVVLHYDGGRNGKVYLYSNVMTANSGSDINSEEIATGLHQPLGVEVVNGEIYINEKTQFSKLTQSGNSWNHSMVYNAHNPWDQRDFYHWFSMGLVYHDSKFYWSLGGFTQYGQFVDELPDRHGTVVEYDPQANSHKFLVHGLRNTGGIGIGPDGSICTNDNQGEWIPSDKFICIKEGLWYGWDGPNALMRNGREASPPSIWNTHNELGNSPGEVRMLHKGPYAGQMVMSDVNRAHLSRLFIEKVNDQYQGANFFFSGGFESGTYRIEWTPDSTGLIVAGIGGNGGGWKYATTYISLHRLETNNNDVFDFLAIRSLGNNQFELEFTEAANNAAGTANNYTVTSWENIPSSGYGAGHKRDSKNLTVTDATTSAGNTKVTLTINGLAEARIIRIAVDNNVRSASGNDTLWASYGDYTLNHFGPADPVPVNPGKLPSQNLFYSFSNNVLQFTENEKFKVEIKNTMGQNVKVFHVDGPSSHDLANFEIAPGMYFLNINNGRSLISEKLVLF